MFYNNKINELRQNQRGKSVGGKQLQFNRVRSFEPKFLQSLNKPSFGQTNNFNRIPIQTRIQQTQSKLYTRQAIKRLQKQNFNPYPSNLNQKSNEITFKKQQIKVKICNIKGLNNIGNTCYMNSILQSLLNLSKFNSQLSEQLLRTKNSKAEVSRQYYNLLQVFSENNSNISVNPSKLKSSIGRKKCRFLGSAQQDAQQFLTAFLQLVNQQISRITQKPKYVELENDPNKRSIKVLSQQWWEYYKKRDDSIIVDHFQGQLLSTVTCKKCNNSSVTFDNTWGMPLGLQKITLSIGQLIKKNWTSDTEINDYYCSKCQKSRVCTKKVQFFRLPQILVIQLKRFQYGRWNKEKLKTPVKLSDTINLSQCVSSYSSNESSVYKLSSIVHHYGQVDYGHYTASVFKQRQKKWYLLNDSKANQNLPDSPSNTAYLLFYEKVKK